MSTTPVEQRTADHVLCFIRQIGVEHQVLKLLAIAVLGLLIELVLEKLGDYFHFSDSTLENHANSFHRRRRMERKNGSETTSSISNISTICTMIPCRKLEWNM